MLHTIESNGNISWHCHRPECTYHNCQGWDREVRCAHHAEAQRNQEPGQTITAHISHEDVQWVSESEIKLPPCPECLEKRGVHSVTTLKVHDDEELTPPIITRDELTGEILQVAPHPHPKFSGNLWIVDADTIRQPVKHPSVAHLSAGQIQELQAEIKNKAPNLPMEGLLTEVTTQKINAVYPHPAVARHRSLATQMIASGKVYQPAPEPETEPAQQPVFTFEQVKALVAQELQAYGVITTPRLPAIPPVPISNE